MYRVGGMKTERRGLRTLSPRRQTYQTCCHWAEWWMPAVSWDDRLCVCLLVLFEHTIFGSLVNAYFCHFPSPLMGKWTPKEMHKRLPANVKGIRAARITLHAHTHRRLIYVALGFIFVEFSCWWKCCESLRSASHFICQPKWTRLSTCLVSTFSLDRYQYSACRNIFWAVPCSHKSICRTISPVSALAVPNAWHLHRFFHGKHRIGRMNSCHNSIII